MRVLGTLLLAALGFFSQGSSANAQSVPESFWGSGALPQLGNHGSLTTEEIQYLLLWVGFYYADINGNWDDETRDAIMRFQASLGARESGRLTTDQEQLLRARGSRAREAAAFQEVHDPWTGISVSLPLGYLSDPEVDPSSKFHVYYFPRGSTTLSVRLSRDPRSWRPQQLVDALVKAFDEIEGSKVIGKSIEGSFVRVIMSAKDRIHFYVYQTGRELRGVKISFDTDRADFFSPIYRQIVFGLKPFDNDGLSEREIDQRIKDGRYPRRQRLPDQLTTLTSSGSGSVVSYQGHILTNNHVVSGCSRLTVNTGNRAVLLGVDVVNDLALVQSERFENREPIRFRKGEAELGEAVIVMGYPVFSMSQSLNVTEGIVSSKKGLFDDRSQIQITAPVQPGNSGGPVLDLFGNQVAVVVSKASSRLRIQNGVENMSWVIRSAVAQDFLEHLGVKPLIASDNQRVGSAQRVASVARSATVRVECHHK